MQAHLYFICPTDYLEPIINHYFKQRNFFYTSLGNSIDFSDNTMDHLRLLILKHSIEEISFVLSENNQIIKDALANQGYSKTLKLSNFYDEIKIQNEVSELVWQQNNGPFTIISHYISKKIQELHLQMDRLNLTQITIQGKIFNPETNVFNDIYSELICKDYFSQN